MSLKALTAKLGQLLALYGFWGLLAISFLDSSFLSFPLVNDLLLVHLCSRRASLAPIYVLLCTVGSVLGALTIYGIARGGGSFLWRKYPPHKMSRVQRWLGRNDFVAVLTASLLPPAAPFKAFLVAAGVLRVNAVRFGAALLVGRTLRFSIEGMLGARYGTVAEAYLAEHFGWLSMVAAAAVVGVALLCRTLARRPTEYP